MIIDLVLVLNSEVIIFCVIWVGVKLRLMVDCFGVVWFISMLGIFKCFKGINMLLFIRVFVIVELKFFMR